VLTDGQVVLLARLREALRRRPFHHRLDAGCRIRRALIVAVTGQLSVLLLRQGSKQSQAAPVSTPIRRIPLGCCARAASGHAAAPPSSVMKSRRLMGLPQGQGSRTKYSRCWSGSVARIAIKSGASARRALDHRQKLRGLSLTQRITSMVMAPNVSGLRKVTWHLLFELGEIARDRGHAEASEDRFLWLAVEQEPEGRFQTALRRMFAPISCDIVTW
jgi:hypothetical protein